MIRRVSMFCISLAVAAGFALSGPASADNGGLAWDSVTKFQQSSDVTGVQPGSFDSDFAAASSAQSPSDSGAGGFLGRARAAMRAGGGMGAAMQSGFAEHHYVAGSKERTDSLFSQTATIVDCTARTITTLDLRAKTYRVESLDQAANTSGGRGGGPSHPPAADDESKVAIDLTNTALGPKDVAGQPTQGYHSLMKITTTKTNGETEVANVDMVAYYAERQQPGVACSARSIAGAGVGGRGAMMGAYANLARMLGSRESERISVTQSGPSVRLGGFAMFDAVRFSSASGGRGMTFVTERGNVRAIDVNDAAFTIPSDFTKQA